MSERTKKVLSICTHPITWLFWAFTGGIIIAFAAWVVWTAINPSESLYRYTSNPGDPNRR